MLAGKWCMKASTYTSRRPTTSHYAPSATSYASRGGSMATHSASGTFWKTSQPRLGSVNLWPSTIGYDVLIPSQKMRTESEYPFVYMKSVSSGLVYEKSETDFSSLFLKAHNLSLTQQSPKNFLKTGFFEIQASIKINLQKVLRAIRSRVQQLSCPIASGNQFLVWATMIYRRVTRPGKFKS